MDDLEVDVDGVPMPAWLLSAPAQVLDFTWKELPGVVVCFERMFNSVAFTCTWPRYASMITSADPSRECGCRFEQYDKDAMTKHAETHAVTGS